jgi:hypothetical protein
MNSMRERSKARIEEQFPVLSEVSEGSDRIEVDAKMRRLQKKSGL